ncbi:MAG: hypothetical protein WC238_04785 [Parcubacteria group bacterium]|jgi:hypothetical protein
MCNCIDINLGTYKAAIPMWFDLRKRVVDIDVCLALEIKNLWWMGIYTIESCCGHNKVDGYIAVDDSCIIHMLDLGYQEYQDKAGFFYPKSVPRIIDDLLTQDNDIEVVGHCGNCGVEYHIHKINALDGLKKSNKNTMNVRAKFVCYGIKDNPPSESKTVTFGAVVSGSEENKSFSKFTPSGSLEMIISYDTPASEAFEQGKEYYLDISPAE